ncbi:MAG: Protein-glutamine gamma-glutamyltransferase [Gammaproteobacteria bacterium]|nr:Protein-glutamine gamma-glutamyltransferase [Gammaproteobacteria bacterium]
MTATRRDELTRPIVAWLAASLLMVVLLHARQQPLWVCGGFLALVLWRILHAWRGVPLPTRDHRMLWLLKHALAIGIFWVVYRRYGGVIGRDAGISLLVLLIGLKLLEMKSRREFVLIALLGFFLLVTAFFYSQSMPVALYALACVTALLGSLVAMAQPGRARSVGANLRLAGTLMLQAAPLMLIAFVLFPRPGSPLWSLPKDARRAISGLSEEMSPGELTRLTMSDAVAFRVAFSTNRPSAAEMYWRGPVLVKTDGRTWTPGDPSDRSAPAITAQGVRYSYSITLEPTNRPWIYALEHPSTVPRGTRLSRDLRVLSARPITDRIRYSAESYTQAWVAEADSEELRAALQLPPGAYPRTRALARQWRLEDRTDEGVVRRALQYFRNEPFVYTLSPAQIYGDPVDGFLFGARQGFCEHYASAFAVLMRAARVPARIVTGYQGGEYNPVGDYYIVRQRDAHAWVEVWLGHRGWVRVDPTAAVAPARVQRGIDQALPGLGATVGGTAADLAVDLAGWRELRYAYDALNNRWNHWVISYNARRQSAMFDDLGLSADWRALSLLLGAGLLLAGALLVAWSLRGRRAHGDAIARAYRRFCAKLARRGHPRAPYEGPMDYARRVSASLPAAAADITRITGLYARARYGQTSSAADAQALRSAVRRFAP